MGVMEDILKAQLEMINEVRELKDEVRELKGAVPVENGEELLTARACAEVMKSTPRWIIERCKEGSLPYMLVGNDYRVKRRELNAFMVKPEIARASAKMDEMRKARRAKTAIASA